MRGFMRKVLGLGLFGILLTTPVLLAQRQLGGGRKGVSGKKGGGRKAGGAGKKAPTKGGRGGN
jgi:hypothetical protein